MEQSMDWFRGNLNRKPSIFPKIMGFPVNVPLNQSIGNNNWTYFGDMSESSESILKRLLEWWLAVVLWDLWGAWKTEAFHRAITGAQITNQPWVDVALQFASKIFQVFKNGFW